MKRILLLALLAAGLSSAAFAESSRNYPPISFFGAGSGKSTVKPDELLILVVEGPTLSCDSNFIPEGGVVAYVNDMLKHKNATHVGVYVRQGAKYGDVVRALDLLRTTNAKSIGVSMAELPPGREP